MKLSDVKGERAFDVIAELVVPVANLAESEDVKALMTPKRKPKGLTAEQFMLQRVKEALPSIVREHKGDVVAILAAIAGVTPEEYVEGMSLPSLITDVIDLMTDDAFTAFLASQDTNGVGGQST